MTMRPIHFMALLLGLGFWPSLTRRNGYFSRNARKSVPLANVGRQGVERTVHPRDRHLRDAVALPEQVVEERGVGRTRFRRVIPVPAGRKREIRPCGTWRRSGSVERQLHDVPRFQQEILAVLGV